MIKRHGIKYSVKRYATLEKGFTRIPNDLFKVNSIVNLTIKDGFEIKGKIIDNIDNTVVINIYEDYNWFIPYENITNVYTEGTYENPYK